LYEVNWTLVLSSWLCGHIACWHITWPLWGRFEICVKDCNSIKLLNNSCSTRQTKQIESEILKRNWNVERLVEHTRQNVAWELIGKWWLERNVRWIWNVSSESWRDVARRFLNIIWGQIFMWVTLVDTLFIYIKARKVYGENLLFLLPTITFFGKYSSFFRSKLLNNEECSDKPTGILLAIFAGYYCLHIHSSSGPTVQAVSNSHQIPKDTLTFTKSAVPIWPAASPLFTVHISSRHSHSLQFLLLN